jgi:probable rRNA maturation factor
MVHRPEILIGSSQTAMRVPRRKITSLIEFVGGAESARLVSVDIAIVGDAEIARLNRQYLRHAGVTDVISFDLSDPEEEGLRAQLVVCAEEAIRQARARGLGVQRELLLYVVHGLLHLTGWDDATDANRLRMQTRQQELLESFLASLRGA